jgi:Kef-type K+ transport system membrane component KefB
MGWPGAMPLATTSIALLAAVVAVTRAGSPIGVVATLAGTAAYATVALGWLMNTRGLTELMVLHVGLSLGVITPALFSICGLMALFTMAMAGPLLERLGYGRRSLSASL